VCAPPKLESFTAPAPHSAHHSERRHDRHALCAWKAALFSSSGVGAGTTVSVARPRSGLPGGAGRRVQMAAAAAAGAIGPGAVAEPLSDDDIICKGRLTVIDAKEIPPESTWCVGTRNPPTTHTTPTTTTTTTTTTHAPHNAGRKAAR
jgi:hypothetical protein